MGYPIIKQIQTPSGIYDINAWHSNTADIATKANQDGNGKIIPDTYETKTAASDKLTEAKNYTNTEIGKIKAYSHFGFRSGVQTYANAPEDGDGYQEVFATTKNECLNWTSTDGMLNFEVIDQGGTDSVNITVLADPLGAAEEVKNDLLNGAGAAYDTLKELGDLIDDNTDAIDALELVAANKADKTHTHTKSEITDFSHVHNYLPLAGGNLTGQLTFSTGTTQSATKGIKWDAINSNTPFIGFATDQVDGTFVIGSLKGTNYASGLAIGGGSGNLLWKGIRVATVNDIPSIPTAIAVFG